MTRNHVAGFSASAMSRAASHSSIPVRHRIPSGTGAHRCRRRRLRRADQSRAHAASCVVVGVGVTDLDRNERDAIELETALVDDGHVSSPTGTCPGNTRSQNSARNCGSFCACISSAVPSVAAHGDARKPLQQRNCAEPVVPVTVGDVYLPQFASRGRDPITDLGGLRCGERRIDQYSVAVVP